MAASSGEPTLAALPTTPCMCQYRRFLQIYRRGSMDDLPKHFHIVLLTQEHCGFCEQAQEILERLAREYWLSVSTLDMGSPEGQRLAVSGGLLFPPGIVIDGEPFS